MFDDVLVWNQGFLYQINNFLTWSKNLSFRKGVAHDFGQKFKISSKFIIL